MGNYSTNCSIKVLCRLKIGFPANDIEFQSFALRIVWGYFTSKPMRFPKCFRTNVIAWVAVLALGLHGLIPVGYMPDFSQPGFPQLVVCDGTDHHAMHHHAGHTGHAHGGVCPFAAAAIDGFGSLTAPVVAPPAYGLTDQVASLLPQPAISAVFSGASPRSPPSFS